MTEALWIRCECGAVCADYNCDGEPDIGPKHDVACVRWREFAVSLCSDCLAVLQVAKTPATDDESARFDFVCPEHGVRATIWQ